LKLEPDLILDVMAEQMEKTEAVAAVEVPRQVVHISHLERSLNSKLSKYEKTTMSNNS
jgi:putative heme iron utilization protein